MMFGRCLMRFRLAVLILLTGFLCTISSTTALAEVTVHNDSGTPIPRDDLSPDAEQVARLINQLRARAGLPPLTIHPLLNRAATGHIAMMVASGVYGHVGYDGSRTADRVARTGYVVDGWVGENWALFGSVAQVIDWWVSHAPHRNNLLNRQYTEMGVGVWPHPAGQNLIVVVDFSTGQLGVAAPRTDTWQKPALHVVVAGDTLSGIGQQYGMNWERIALQNGLTAVSLLQIGQVLTLAGASHTNTGVATELAPTWAAFARDKTASSRMYVVQAGDSLWGIAAQLGIPLSALMKHNGLSEASILFPEQVLHLP